MSAIALHGLAVSVGSGATPAANEARAADGRFEAMLGELQPPSGTAAPGAEKPSGRSPPGGVSGEGQARRSGADAAEDAPSLQAALAALGYLGALPARADAAKAGGEGETPGARAATRSALAASASGAASSATVGAALAAAADALAGPPDASGGPHALDWDLSGGTPLKSLLASDPRLGLRSFAMQTHLAMVGAAPARSGAASLRAETGWSSETADGRGLDLAGKAATALSTAAAGLHASEGETSRGETSRGESSRSEASMGEASTREASTREASTREASTSKTGVVARDLAARAPAGTSAVAAQAAPRLAAGASAGTAPAAAAQRASAAAPGRGGSDAATLNAGRGSHARGSSLAASPHRALAPAHPGAVARFAALPAPPAGRARDEIAPADPTNAPTDAVAAAAETAAAPAVTLPLSELPRFIADQASRLAEPSASAGANASAGPAAALRAPQSVKELQIALEPGELGALSLKLRLNDGKLSVTIGVANASTLAALSDERDAIAERLGAGQQKLEEIVIRPQSAPNGAESQHGGDFSNGGFSAESGSSRGEGGAPRRQAPTHGDPSGGGAGPGGALDGYLV